MKSEALPSPMKKPDAPPSSKKKPDVPPSPEKKPNASGRSADRIQGTPSEPNPKAPSASKAKRVATGKKAKVDDAAEEQPELKKKLSSKGKKLIEEETAPSNPRKKRPRKHQQEFAAVVAVEAPSAKDSSQKKTAPLWSDNDETVITHGFEKIMSETRDMVTEFTRDVKKLIENSEDRKRALLDSYLGLTNGTRGAGGEAGRRLNSAAWLSDREPDLEGIYSIQEIPVVDEDKAQLIEGILRELRILDLEVSLQQYALLQEECSMKIEALKGTNDNAGLQ